MSRPLGNEGLPGPMLQIEAALGYSPIPVRLEMSVALWDKGAISDPLRVPHSFNYTGFGAQIGLTQRIVDLGFTSQALVLPNGQGIQIGAQLVIF